MVDKQCRLPCIWPSKGIKADGWGTEAIPQMRYGLMQHDWEDFCLGKVCTNHLEVSYARP